MELTKEKLQAIRVDLQAALDAVARKHGLAQFIAGNCTFDRTGSFSWKLEGVADGGLAKEQRTYDENRWLGLPERGSEFKQGGKVHKTWGLTRGSKVITECSDGKRYTWKVDAIRSYFPQVTKPLTHAELLGKDPIAADLKKIVSACKDGGAR